MPDFGAESASLLAYLRLLYSIPPISYVKGSEREDREQADIAALSAIETALRKAAGGRKKSDNGPRLLRTTEIAKRYSLSEALFNILRSTGGGPPFIKASHRVILYAPEKVDAWFKAPSRNSTTADKSCPPHTAPLPGPPRQSP